VRERLPSPVARSARLPARNRIKYFLLGMTASTVMLAIGGLAYLRLGFAEVRADIPPPRLQTSLMHLALHASVRRNAPQIPDPVPPTSDDLIAGAKIYRNDCAGCHGTPGKPQRFPSGLVPAPRQFESEPTEFTKAQIFWIAKNGIRRSGMFVFGYGVSDADLWRVAAFVSQMDHLPPAVQQKSSP
jgi:thiosulfate dehydrogenase